jgi:hypothetical protein
MVEKYMSETYKLKIQHSLLLQAKMAALKPFIEEAAFGKDKGASFKSGSASGSKKGDAGKHITYPE